MSIRSKLVCLRDNNLYLKYLWLQTIYRARWKRRSSMSDIDCINYIYKLYCGHYPDLENPTTYSEKLQWMKLHYRNELMPILADKYAVRKYLEDKGYGYLLNDLIAVYDNIKEFDPNCLPERFVLKATHGSGWNLIVTEKKRIHWGIARLIMKYWLTHDIAWNGREWPYGEMTPRIVCEKYLEDTSGSLMDYKFYCMNGKVEFMQLNVDRFTENPTQNFYDMDWNLMPFGKHKPHNPNFHADKPKHFDDMVRIATELCKPFPHVRIDFYEVNDRIYFGEFTFFSFCGMPDFIPVEYDTVVGNMLTLPVANR